MLAAGTTIAGYRVDRVVGQGGMGVVYEATQLSLQRTIALKLLAAELSEDPSFRERFRREGLLQGGLDHPHIIPVYEAGESPHGLFLAMRLVRGPDLKRLLRRAALDERRTLRILAQVADALDSAHEAGLTHRDIKPQNVLVAARDHAYLADFGLTKAPGVDSLTSSGRFVGTVNYTSPEQIRGEGASAASDVYALTAVLYESLCGQVPFPRESEAAVIYAHLQEPPPRPSAAAPGLPYDLDEVVQRGMSKYPSQRFGTAGELVWHAARALGMEAITPIRELDPTRPSARRASGAAAGVGERGEAGAQDSTPSGPTLTLGAPAERRRLRLPSWALAVGALLGLAVVVGAFLAGRAGAGDDEGPPTRQLRSSRVSVQVPASWRAAAGPRVPGLRLAGGVAAVPRSLPGAALHAGHTEAPNATLLPGDLLVRLRRPPDRPARVRLGSLQAVRYDGLRPRGLGGTLTLYAVPASSGVATLACVAPPRAAELLARCREAAATLRVQDGRPFPLSPREGYARRLTSVLRALNRLRERSRDRLRFATDATIQAQAAEDLAGAYKAARRTLAAVRISPAEAAAHDALLRALMGARAAHLRLASAARAQDNGGYNAARSDVGRTEGLVASALRGLRPLGYRAR